MTGSPLIDRGVVDDLVEAIGADGARSVIDLFVAEVSRYLATIAAAGEGSDPVRRDQARRAAHALKSGAGQVGAAAVAAAAAELERLATAGAPLAEALAALRQAASQTTAALANLPNRT